MQTKVHPKSGQMLGLSTVAFTVCFAVWTLFAIIGIEIREDLGLTETQFGLLVGTPILTGSLIRVALGIWTDLYGGRVYLPPRCSPRRLRLSCDLANTYPEMLVAALGVGIAGGSFAVGVAYVSRWYPAEKQGTALGIFGAGNVGAAVTKFIAPFVLVAYGWHMVAQVWAAALVVMAVIFWFMAEDDPVLVERRRAGIKPKPAWLNSSRSEMSKSGASLSITSSSSEPLSLWRCGCRNISSTSMASTSERPGCFAASSLCPPAFSAPMAGHLSDTYGVRRVLYWTFLVAVATTFISPIRPPTMWLDHEGAGCLPYGNGRRRLYRYGFCARLLHGPGKAAVYKHIPHITQAMSVLLAGSLA